MTTKATFQSCYSRLDQCMNADRQRFRRQLDKLRRQQGDDSTETRLGKLSSAIDDSISTVRARLENRPATSYPESLPVSQKKDEIAEAIKNHQVVILCGETGSGKTTQLPKICLELGLGSRGLIGHTQPRRLAARAVATRIAEELGSPLGEAVGYKVRFTDHSRRDSYIKLMTDGILLAECHHDPFLNQYDTLIIDEAHERSLNIDFLLGYLRRLLAKRHDLKIIITSATIDPQRFARHFNDAPVINVSGRTYPVEVLYRPLQSEEADSNFQQKNLQQGVLDAVNELSRLDRGDILVFLSGERDIRETADALAKQAKHNRALAHTEILPLLARQSASEQNRIFHPHGKRRIILATNVAETSLTVPGIKYVIDSGLARISRYSWRSKIQRLPIEKISQASANQRKGRCGRVSEGVCIRLYDEADFLDRDEFTLPEIKRTNLAAVILQMEFLRLGHIDDFPFVEPPEQRLIKDGYKLLFELGAINDTNSEKKNRLTAIGKKLARLPIDPRLGRMLIEAEQEASLNEVLVIVAALATQDVRERPLDKKQAADEKHRLFADKQSDFMFYLNCWQAYHKEKSVLSNNQLRKWCKTHFLSWMRFREWIDTHNQVRQNLKDMQCRFNTQSADYAAIHRALLTGLLGNIGLKDEDREYLGARGKKFQIFPGSALFKKSARWIMSAEIVETSRVYARTNANIEPQWIEDMAAHLLKHSYSEPQWHARQAQVNALEQASLYGLILYTRKRINYGPVNPPEAREIFIRHALVRQAFNCHADFFRHNKKLIEEIRALEAKARKPDILVDEQQLYDFYDSRIPASVYNGPLFNRWYKKTGKAERQALQLTRQDLMQHDAVAINEQAFPDYFETAGMQFPLSYHFDLHHSRDGITLTTPLAGLAALNPQRCEWLVPGLLQTKMTELIRSLPKKLRRNFVPAPDFARACYEALQAGELSLTAAMSNHLKQMSGIDIPYDAWRPEQLDAHFFMNFRVIDAQGKTLAEGRDLAEIKDRLAQHTRAQPAESFTAQQENVDATVLDAMPETIEETHHGVKVIAYPALVKQGNRVALRALVSREKARAETRSGLRQLFINALPAEVKSLKQNLPDWQKLSLKYAAFGNAAQLQQEIISAVFDEVFLSEPVTTQADFQRVLNSGKGRLASSCEKFSQLLHNILDEHRRISQQLKKPALSMLDTVTDIQSQLTHLLPENFISQTELQWLEHYPRYLAAINQRLDKAKNNPVRERQLRLQIAPFWQAYLQRETLHKKNHIQSAQLQQFRWMLEEFRVSLFAQALKTQFPVSEKRLKKYWNDISDA